MERYSIPRVFFFFDRGAACAKLLGMEGSMETMESVSEIYRNGRALMSYVYMSGKWGNRAKIIIVRAEKDYEGIAVYGNGNMMSMWGHDKRRLMSAMKREVKRTLDK